MFRWEPEGRYFHKLCTALAPFWFSTEHLWMMIMPFWLSTDDIHPSKKSNADFDGLNFFYPVFLFIKLRYLWKACLFAFRLMPYLLGLFYWGACRLSKLGATSKMKGCKIDRIDREIHVIASLPFVSYAQYPRPTFHQILRNFGGIAAQWMGRGYACIHSQKESRKLDITCISHSIRSIWQPFILDVAPNLYPARAPVLQS